MTDEDHHATAARTRPVKKGATAGLLRWGARRRPHRPLLEFDALAAYLGLLIGVALGAASPTVAPTVANAAAQLCVVGALEVGRDGAAECPPP